MSYTLSKKEVEMMEIFWDSDEALSREGILQKASTRQCSWKPNSVSILVNSLLKKGALEVNGFYSNSRKLGRLFHRAITREEYSLMQVRIALENGKQLSGLEPQEALQILIKEYQND